MTPAEFARVNARLDEMTADVRRLRGDVERVEALLNGHMDARALDPGGHLHVDNWPEVDEPEPALPHEVTT